MSPIDYSIDVANPIDSALKGYQAGIGITQVQREQQQQQIALEQQQKQQQVIRNLIANPSAGADEYAAAQLLVPGMSKQLEQAWTNKNKAQQQSHLSDLSQWGAAIQNGQPQIAVDAMNARADALENTTGSPTQESQALRAQAQVIKEHPEFGNFMIKSMLVAHPDGKQVVDNIVALGGEQRAQDLAPGAVRKGAADAGEAEAGLALKNLGILGQTAGALAKPGVKPGQAIAMFKSLEARGIIPKGGAQGYIDGIPSSDKDLPDYLASVRDAGIKPDEQKKFTTPDANTVANNATSRYTADSTARTAAARLTFDKDQADAADAPDTTSDAEKKNWVHQYVAGNGSVPRSAPASVRNHVGTWAAEMGITPADLSAGSAQAKFDMATAVTSGHRAGSMASVEATMPALTANAMELSHKLGQGKFVPLNQLIQMADDKISDPALSAFKVAHQAVVSEYQQVISRGGTNVTALKEAMHVLNGAKSMQAYDVALNQVNKEVAINVAGTKAVRASLGGQHGSAPAPAASAAHPADISALLNKYGSK